MAARTFLDDNQIALPVPSVSGKTTFNAYDLGSAGETINLDQGRAYSILARAVVSFQIRTRDGSGITANNDFIQIPAGGRFDFGTDHTSSLEIAFEQGGMADLIAW